MGTSKLQQTNDESQLLGIVVKSNEVTTQMQTTKESLDSIPLPPEPPQSNTSKETSDMETNNFRFQLTKCVDYTIDSFEVLEQTILKQKRLSRTKTSDLRRKILLKRTFELVCEIMDHENGFDEFSVDDEDLSSTKSKSEAEESNEPMREEEPTKKEDDYEVEDKDDDSSDSSSDDSSSSSSSSSSSDSDSDEEERSYHRRIKAKTLTRRRRRASSMANKDQTIPRQKKFKSELLKEKISSPNLKSIALKKFSIKSKKFSFRKSRKLELKRSHLKLKTTSLKLQKKRNFHLKCIKSTTKIRKNSNSNLNEDPTLHSSESIELTKIQQTSLTLSKIKPDFNLAAIALPTALVNQSQCFNYSNQFSDAEQTASTDTSANATSHSRDNEVPQSHFDADIIDLSTASYDGDDFSELFRDDAKNTRNMQHHCHASDQQLICMNLNAMDKSSERNSNTTSASSCKRRYKDINGENENQNDYLDVKRIKLNIVN